MRKIFTSSLVFFFSLLCYSTIFGQDKIESIINNKMSFELKNDTLFSNTGFMIFAGQKLRLGEAAGEEGRYRSVISGKAAIVPSIWGQNKNYDYAIENYVDSKKNKAQLRQSLSPGKLFTVKQIIFWKESKPGFYMCILKSDTEVYKCDVKMALTFKELLLEK